MSIRTFPEGYVPSLGRSVRSNYNQLSVSGGGSIADLVSVDIVNNAGRRDIVWREGDSLANIWDGLQLYFPPAQAFTAIDRPSRWDIEGSVSASDSGLKADSDEATAAEARKLFCLPRYLVYEEGRTKLHADIECHLNVWTYGSANNPYPRALFVPRLLGFKYLPGLTGDGASTQGWYRLSGTAQSVSDRVPGVLPSVFYTTTRSVRSPTIVAGRTPAAISEAIVLSHQLGWDYYVVTLAPRVSNVPYELHSASLRRSVILDLEDFVYPSPLSFLGDIPRVRRAEGVRVWPTLAIEFRDQGNDTVTLSDNSYIGLSFDVLDEYREKWSPRGQS